MTCQTKCNCDCKPTLKMRTQQTHKVDYQDLNRYIMQVYHLDNFEGHLESSNDTSWEHTVSGNQRDQKELQYILDKKSCTIHMVGVVLDDLAFQNLIPEGEYIVSVSW